MHDDVMLTTIAVTATIATLALAGWIIAIDAADPTAYLLIAAALGTLTCVITSRPGQG